MARVLRARSSLFFISGAYLFCIFIANSHGWIWLLLIDVLSWGALHRYSKLIPFSSFTSRLIGALFGGWWGGGIYDNGWIDDGRTNGGIGIKKGIFSILVSFLFSAFSLYLI
ncbi:hypothetical protein B9Z19DRAFT_823768 [Tuber borchii]|uniref:Uncharacterized protein n=1 Tax=Tuber borchii TaxID=42251 RepID=A0A2T6ZVF4_TUBBO|nr:hypothetical protein B9Z19DRAFT_823768 [Tuber borchii]